VLTSNPILSHYVPIGVRINGFVVDVAVVGSDSDDDGR
jgi:hypothetical protein